MMRGRRLAALTLAFLFAGAAGGLAAEEPAGNPYHDPPPLQATNGIPGCAAPVARVLGPDEARREAHQRIERGTSCWLAGQCEPGGDYRDDGEINARVASALAADVRLARTAVWVETLRKFVTLKGCIGHAAEGEMLGAVARAVPGVKLVWIETKVVGPGVAERP